MFSKKYHRSTETRVMTDMDLLLLNVNATRWIPTLVDFALRS